MSGAAAAPGSPVSPGTAEEASLLEAGLLELGADGYGSIPDKGSSAASKDGKGEKKGGGKKAKKAVSDMLKTEMASERTFFKWFRTGLQIGAIGTFVFIALDKGEDTPWRFAVVAFAWLVGLLLVLHGVYSYYQRRAAIRRGDPEVAPDCLREHSPLLVVAALVLVVGAGLVYALVTGRSPSTGRMGYWPAPRGAPPAAYGPAPAAVAPAPATATVTAARKQRAAMSATYEAREHRVRAEGHRPLSVAAGRGMTGVL